MDGNNSAKRSGAALRQGEEMSDSRQICGDRWVSREEVDQFKDEVRTRSVSTVRFSTTCASYFIHSDFAWKGDGT